MDKRIERDEEVYRNVCVGKGHQFVPTGVVDTFCQRCGQLLASLYEPAPMIEWSPTIYPTTAASP